MLQMSHTTCSISPSRDFSAGVAKQRILFLKEVLCFHKATSFLEHKVVHKLGSHRIFFLTEVLLFHGHTDFPIMGASDMSQESICPLRRHKPIMWPLIRTQECNMSLGCSLGLSANTGPMNRT